jgi:hypothetical protein
LGVGDLHLGVFAYSATWCAELEDSMASIRSLRSKLVCVLTELLLPNGLM